VTILNLHGMESIVPTGKAIVLTSGSPGDENSFSQPTKVAPMEKIASGLGASFQYEFPANSVTILHINRRP